MRLTRLRMVLLVAAILTAILCGRVAELVAVDRCLDGGGAYDYTLGRCEWDRSPEFPAPREGPPGVRAWSELGSIVAVAGLLTVFWWRDRRRGARPG